MKRSYFVCPACGKVTNDISEFATYEKYIREYKLLNLEEEDLPREYIDFFGNSGLYHEECDTHLDIAFCEGITVIIEDGKIIHYGFALENLDKEEILLKIAALEV